MSELQSEIENNFTMLKSKSTTNDTFSSNKYKFTKYRNLLNIIIKQN